MKHAMLMLAVATLGAGCSVQRVNRAALVPHMTPALRSGAPMETPGELAVGLSSVADASLGSTDAAAAVEVPGTQAEGAMRVRLGRHAAIGLIAADGFAATAEAAKPNQPPVDGGDVHGWGLVINGMVPTGDPHWHVGIDAELMAWTVPYVEYSTCIDNCAGVPWSSVEHGTSTVGQVALGVVPTYSKGDINVWGGLTFRTHPTIEQKGIEVGLDTTDEVEAGTFNTVLSAGADIGLGHGVRAGATVYQVVQGQPVDYGPSLALTLTLPLGARDAPPAAIAAPSSGPPGAR
ncbi:MAG: hypothetical protein IPL61_24505 [Myxococcales bacterium]|nr:hypothetical protein [Myxococcales bacterium]